MLKNSLRLWLSNSNNKNVFFHLVFIPKVSYFLDSPRITESWCLYRMLRQGTQKMLPIVLAKVPFKMTIIHILAMCE